MTTIEKRNENALKVKKDQINKKFGKYVQILTEASDLPPNGILALPAGARSGKPISWKLNRTTIDARPGMGEKVISRDIVNVKEGFVDVNEELQRQVDEIEGRKPLKIMNNKPRKNEKFFKELAGNLLK